ncbi:MAG: LysM peptidoglycan-binding domain-containing protein [Phycisphaerales bacterium]|nr:LysM peptidoglycan-binding domain-containing protein [Phycisphaerales bacterium]MCB9858697.1 LysM peptidoglycan-binding domain-containing protein [Phycisphaerales bacterium]MCB9864447.1 LysM peptidoglycan-binding domain-containing protein [Phycisphaerales bacterium]
MTKTTDTWTAPGRENTTVPPARMPAVGKVDPAAKPMTGESTAAGIAIAKNDSSATPIARVSDDNASNPAKSDQRPIRVAGRTNASIPPARSDSDANRTANRRTPSAFKPVAVAPASAPEIEIWPKKHTIATGDTLSDISMEYYGTSHRFDLILKANPDIKGPRSLRVGRELIIPRFETSAETSTIVKLSSMNDAPAARSSTARRSSTSPVVVAPKRRYSVQKGDTFYSIARKLYGSTDRWQDLFNANKATVSNPSRLRPGMELVVPN